MRRVNTMLPVSVHKPRFYKRRINRYPAHPGGEIPGAAFTDEEGPGLSSRSLPYNQKL